MKKVLCALLVVGMSGVAWGADEEVVPGMAKKFGHGLVNTLTGIVELPVQTVKGYEKGVSFIKHEPTSKVVGTILGFFRGIGHGVGRTAHGAVDVVTFWSANRESNEGIGIPLDATFAWEQGEQYSIMKPNLKEGLMPYPRKLGHGLADGFLGVLELPGQIYKGAKSDNPAAGVPVGIVKGLWYSLSRVSTGFTDAVLFIVPNPEETYGYAYDCTWPVCGLCGCCKDGEMCGMKKKE